MCIYQNVNSFFNHRDNGMYVTRALNSLPPVCFLVFPVGFEEAVEDSGTYTTTKLKPAGTSLPESEI